jgi:hypothetical protein
MVQICLSELQARINILLPPPQGIEKTPDTNQ